MQRLCPACFTELTQEANYCPVCGKCMRERQCRDITSIIYRKDKGESFKKEKGSSETKSQK